MLHHAAASVCVFCNEWEQTTVNRTEQVAVFQRIYASCLAWGFDPPSCYIPRLRGYARQNVKYSTEWVGCGVDVGWMWGGFLGLAFLVLDPIHRLVTHCEEINLARASGQDLPRTLGNCIQSPQSQC